MRLNPALKFVLLIGIGSFFADFTYEGSRSITGPFLAVLGASGAIVGTVAGFGELAGYGLRIFSGIFSDRTRQFWPITLIGYAIQLSSIPLLAFSKTWPEAAALIVAERVGRAIRTPPRDVMLSHAVKHMGYGWGFGLHEAMDQAGALVGPLVVALILTGRGQYRQAFALLLVPAVITYGLVLLARFLYPNPEGVGLQDRTIHPLGFSRCFWTYLIGAALVAAGFADWALIAFHFQKTGAVPSSWIPVFYAIAMAVGGAGSLVFGRWFDRAGIRVLIPLTVVSSLFALFVFFGGFWTILIGAALWGLGMGVHESIIPAVVAQMVPVTRRASAYGLFTATYGVAWFAGSAILGALYDRSLTAAVAFCIAIELLAIPFFWRVARGVVS